MQTLPAALPSLCFTGNILQSPAVAAGAGEALHPRIHGHVADRQQGRLGPRSTGVRAGAGTGKLI